MIDKFLNYFRELPETGIKIVSDKAVTKANTPTIANNYLELIKNEETRQLMYELREIRGTDPIDKADKSDTELIFEAFQMMEIEGD